MNGKKNWYIVDGYRPPLQSGGDSCYEGHESFMVLNCNEVEAHVLIDVYFEDRDPVVGIPVTIPAKRIKAFRSDDVDILNGLKLAVGQQYSIVFRSDVEIVVQYGRCDVAQANLAYMALMGYSE